MRWSIVIMAVLVFFGGCQKSQAPLPQSVAREFWSAMQQGDLKHAKALTVRGRVDEPLFKVKLLKTETEGARVVKGRAFVPVVLFFENPVDRSAGECNTTVDTELLKIEGEWLVDDAVTMQNYNDALKNGVAECASRAIGRAVAEGVESFESVKKELEENFQGIAEELGKSFEAIQEELLDSLKRIQRELQKEPPKLPEPAEGDRI